MVHLELFKHNSPVAWGIGALIFIVGGILALKNLPAFSGKQVFALLMAIIGGIISVILIDRLLPAGAPPKKNLTLWFHAHGDVSSRPLYDQGYAVLINNQGEHLEEEIRKQGMVDFLDLPDWVFDPQKGVRLVLVEVDTAKFQIEDRVRFFKANDTVKIELKQVKPVDVKPQSTTTVENRRGATTHPLTPPERTTFSLVFEHKGSNTRMPFDFDKNGTVKELKAHILSKFEKTLQIGKNVGNISIVHNNQVIRPENENKKIIELNFRDNSVISINATVIFMLKYKKVAFHFKGKKFTKPTLFINDDKVEAGLIKNQPELMLLRATHSVSEGQDSCQVTIRDGSTMYKFKAKVAGLNSVEIDMRNKRGVDLPEFRFTTPFQLIKTGEN